MSSMGSALMKNQNYREVLTSLYQLEVLDITSTAVILSLLFPEMTYDAGKGSDSDSIENKSPDSMGNLQYGNATKENQNEVDSHTVQLPLISIQINKNPWSNVAHA